MPDVNVTKPIIASVPDVLYTFLVANITCLTSEQQPSLDGGILSDVPYQHAMQMNVHQRITVTQNERRKKTKIKSNEI